MSSRAYTEDQLVEQPAIGLFAALRWATVSALAETFGAIGTQERETKAEVVLVSRLRATWVMLNPALQYFAYWQDVLDNVVQQAIDRVVDRVPDSVMVMEQKIFVKALLALTLNKLKNIREK